VRSYEDSVRIEGAAMASRGIQLPPFYTGEGQRPPVAEAMLPESIYGTGAPLAAAMPAAPRPGMTTTLPGAATSVVMVGGAGYRPTAGG
jgi:hypothetical protein